MDISGGAEGMLEQLRGRWRVVRVLHHQSGAWVRFSGVADWHPEGVGLRCVESGEMIQGNTAFHARRETVWQADSGWILVAFGDGRPFHDFRPATTVRAWHGCAPDTYRLDYDFTAREFWSCRWRVTGPRKAYRAITRHWRAVSHDVGI